MDFEKIITELKESLEQRSKNTSETTWYKDGIINCADAFCNELRDSGLITEEEFHLSIKLFGELGFQYSNLKHGL